MPTPRATASLEGTPPPCARRRGLTLLLCATLFALACGDHTLAQSTAKTLASSDAASGVSLGTGATSIPLAAVRETSDGLAIGPAAPIGDRLRRAAADRQVYLQLQALSVQDAPGVSYNVYLNLPTGQAPQGTDDPHFAGVMSFFNAERGRGSDLSLNITAPLKRLLDRGAIADDLRVTIVPAGEPNPAARPRIGKILVTTK